MSNITAIIKIRVDNIVICRKTLGYLVNWDCLINIYFRIFFNYNYIYILFLIEI